MKRLDANYGKRLKQLFWRSLRACYELDFLFSSQGFSSHVFDGGAQADSVKSLSPSLSASVSNSFCEKSSPNILKDIVKHLLLATLVSIGVLNVLFLVAGFNPIEIYETAIKNVQSQPIILIPFILVVMGASAIGLMLGYIFTRRLKQIPKLELRRDRADYNDFYKNQQQILAGSPTPETPLQAEFATERLDHVRKQLRDIVFQQAEWLR